MARGWDVARNPASWAVTAIVTRVDALPAMRTRARREPRS